MKHLLFTLFLFTMCYVRTQAQPNCNSYPPNSLCRKACTYYHQAISYDQGSALSQQYFDSAIAICPTFAEAYREKSVPYLKRGDFYTWKKLMDAAVRLEPKMYLGTRGWCRFKFLGDYQGALEDLSRLDTLTKGQMGQSGNGDYDLRIVMALCKRELGDLTGALTDFNCSIGNNEKKDFVGFYDYLHVGVTKLMLKDYQGALADLQKQVKKYEQLADTYYSIGLVYNHLQKPEQAKKELIKAKELYTHKGFRMNDPYNALLDQVYLSDIEAALQKIAR